MSALKHGFFSSGYMHCDRCVLNARCDQFTPGCECAREKEAYTWTVKELAAQYGLEGLADDILASRAAKCLIRITRVENYEASIGMTDKTLLLGRYISRLDNALRGLMNDLAITRVKRMQLDRKEQLMVSLDVLLEKLNRRHAARIRKIVLMKRVRIRRNPMRRLLVEWRRESRELRRMMASMKEKEEEKTRS